MSERAARRSRSRKESRTTGAVTLTTVLGLFVARAFLRIPAFSSLVLLSAAGVAVACAVLLTGLQHARTLASRNNELTVNGLPTMPVAVVVGQVRSVMRMFEGRFTKSGQVVRIQPMSVRDAMNSAAAVVVCDKQALNSGNFESASRIIVLEPRTRGAGVESVENGRIFIARNTQGIAQLLDIDLKRPGYRVECIARRVGITVAYAAPCIAATLVLALFAVVWAVVAGVL